MFLVVALVAIAAILVSGGTVMAAGGWHGGGHGGGHAHGGHGGGHWHGGWGGWWGWPFYSLGLAVGAVLSFPYYYNYPSYQYQYYSNPSYYDPYAYAQAYQPPPRVIVREREPAYADERVYSEPAPARYSARDTWSWYYCRESNAYYPYVRRCAGGWESVPAVPPSSGPDDDR
jgi:hypothetical protein